jgi:NADH-quinone oxidoreductase subunit F
MNEQEREILNQYEKDRGSLLPLLARYQELEGYISGDVIRGIGEHLDISDNDIYSVAGFYPVFRLAAKGEEKGIKEKEAGSFRHRCEEAIALRNCGEIDPEDIGSYMGRGGYSGLKKAVTMTPEDVIKEIKAAGLKGRGGAGFSTAEKWAACLRQDSKRKYVICNAAEGDPEVYIAKVILEEDPHSVLEGLVIAGYACGASNGFIYINHGYVKAIERVRAGIKRMKEENLLGEKILGTGFCFDIEVFEGAGAFIAGEETALLNSMEGKRGSTSIRPPYPSESGLRGRPTAINNVETLSHAGAILEKGAAWYAGIGTKDSKGTKVFVVSGDVANPGLIEVPLGTSLRKVIEGIAGGVAGGKRLKAVQVGGPTGGFVTEAGLDLLLDYETLKAAGHIMGSGGLYVVDEGACAVDLARKRLSYLEGESCGKCVFCREGTLQFALMLTDISEGRGRAEDIEVLEEFGEGMKEGAFCAFGKTAANPVLTTIKAFKDEYVEHIGNHRCPAGVCKIG